METVTTACIGNKTWPVQVSKIREGEFQISARGTAYQVVLVPHVHGVLVAITNWNRCGYLNYNGGYTAEDVNNYLDMGNQVDAASIAAGLNEIMQNEMLRPAEIQRFIQRRKAMYENLRRGLA